jgi:hypothetical protein
MIAKGQLIARSKDAPMDWACIFHSDCAESVKPAVITAVVAVLALILNSCISLLVWRTTRQFNLASLKQSSRLAEENHERAKDIENFRRTLDLRTEARREQLARLRELQRVAERIQQQAGEISHLQRALIGPYRSAETIDGFVASAGEYLRVASGIFVPPAAGVANLPLACNGPFKELRRAVVKVTLVLDIQEDGQGEARAQAMNGAIEGLNAAVDEFVHVIQLEEQRPIEEVQPCPVAASLIEQS